MVDGAFTFTVQDSAGDGAGAGVTDVLVEVNTTGATASNALVPHQQHQHKHQQAATGPPQLLTCASGLRVLMLALQERVASSAAEFQQELLDAVLCLILSSPRRILPLSDVISTVRLSLVTGVQALQAVQVLSHQLLADKEALMPHLASLLPLFDKYLSGASSAAGGAGDEKDKLFLRSAAALSKMTKKSKTAAKSTSTTAAEESGMEGAPYAVQVQYALLRFLGRLGGASQQILVPASQTVQGSLVWSDKECVCIDLPAAAPAGAGGARGVQATAQTQAHLRLCLDVVLPRIISLCDASSSGTVDPQALSAAAEALHAMVLYMVGTASAVANARAKNTHFSALYERIFPTVIRLSVTDFLCRGLFEKLLFQLIRWFSGHGQVSDRDAGALLDALFSRLGDPSSEGTEREVQYVQFCYLCCLCALDFVLFATKLQFFFSIALIYAFSVW